MTACAVVWYSLLALHAVGAGRVRRTQYGIYQAGIYTFVWDLLLIGYCCTSSSRLIQCMGRTHTGCRLHSCCVHSKVGWAALLGWQGAECCSRVGCLSTVPAV